MTVSILTDSPTLHNVGVNGLTMLGAKSFSTTGSGFASLAFTFNTSVLVASPSLFLAQTSYVPSSDFLTFEIRMMLRIEKKIMCLILGVLSLEL